MSSNIKGFQAKNAFRLAAARAQIRDGLANISQMTGALSVVKSVTTSLFDKDLNPNVPALAELARAMIGEVRNQIVTANPKLSKPELKPEFEIEYNKQLKAKMMLSPSLLMGMRHLATVNNMTGHLQLCKEVDEGLAKLRTVTQIQAPSKEADADAKGNGADAKATAAAGSAAAPAASNSGAAQSASASGAAAAQVEVIEESKQRCANSKCKSTAKAVYNCACKKVFYCNEHCQKAHWTKHKPDCTAKKATKH